ncbi:MAG TPA: M20/M25/M40 family metallo-hydrolase [Gemmatimonadaceae bacterium]|nr:M20/M25/M40 family metallo-hydrolase [Gemmatimonadaceae bacterium]
MRRTALVLLAATTLACRAAPAPSPAPAAPAPAAPGVAAAAAGDTISVAQLAVPLAADPAAVRAIVAEGMNRSRVAADLEYLTDVIGPRLTGSAGMRRANEWTAERFRAYGADSVWTEEWPFGRTWERGAISVRMLEPQQRWLGAVSWAWSPGTNGAARGDVVYVDARDAADFDARFAGRLRGAWVMTRAPLPMPNPDGDPLTAADSADLLARRRALFAPPASAAERAFRASLPSLLAREGAAGIIRSGDKEFALYTMSGSPMAISALPQIVVSHETYSQFHRLLAARTPVRIEASITNTLSERPVTSLNTVAEIRGTERPDEVVLLGAHLDSWDLATGATDNATGSIAVLEAARILKAAGVRPKRTIRFALFSGEEQGLFGSRAYAETHRAELDRYQAVLVLDNGTGRITGMALQGRNELRDFWRALFAPIGALGPFSVRAGNKGGTDHLSFLPFGVPGFNFDQLSRGYDHTHHSQVDTYDHALPDDVKQAATVMAATAYQLANAGMLLPRNPAPRTETRE